MPKFVNNIRPNLKYENNIWTEFQWYEPEKPQQLEVGILL
jgi:hypothetical protein